MSFKKKIGSLFSGAHTPAQKMNLALARFHHYFKHTHLLSYPIKLTIDPSNFCNLSCRLCPVGTGSQLRRQSKMSFEIFKRIIDECGKYLYWIDLFNWGEPLLNKDIFRMIEYARRHRPYITLSTNLNILDGDIAEKLILSGPDKLVISLDGASQDTVERYQAGSNFANVIRNLKRVILLRERANSNSPFIQWNFIVNTYNEHEIKKARAMAGEMKVDHLYIGPLHCNMGEELLMDSKTQFEDIKVWLPENSDYSLYNYQRREKEMIHKSCNIPWFESVINPEGSISPCCAVWPEEYDFGDMGSSFKSVWNGQLYKEARESLFKPGPSRTICNTCKKNRAFI